MILQTRFCNLSLPFLRQVFLFLLILFAPLDVAFAGEQHVEQFFKSCVGSLPDFSNFDKTLEETGYKKTAENGWIGLSPDAPFISVTSKPDRLVCSLSLTGDHTGLFSKSLLGILERNPDWRYELKQHEGRSLYLVQTELGSTILEVVPPNGASTFILANSLKR
ncbi:hypothetical protein LP7551_02100 [Roseibium album]|nr:hypothetical protein LP7551_02100 [Roseibium album]